MLSLHGTGVALITPFQKDLSIDFEGLKKVMDHVIQGGADYLVVQGTTGESPTLSKEEKKQVLKAAKEHNAERLPIVYGIGGNNSQAILDEIKLTDFTDVAAILSVSPSYNKPSQAGIIAHFTAIADASPVPVILYNVPGRTMSNMTAATTVTLSHHSNIIGMKEASGNLEQCMNIASEKQADFMLISGDDMLTTTIRAIGGVGVISVLANAYPTLFKTMSHGDLLASKEATFKLLTLNPLMYEESNPVGLKFLMNQLGICEDWVRLPLLQASPELQEKIKSNMISR